MVIQTIDMPAMNITSVCWGGTHLDVLYATSAQTGLTKDQLLENPKNGLTFAITGLKTKGSPASKYIISRELVKDIMNKN